MKWKFILPTAAALTLSASLLSSCAAPDLTSLMGDPAPPSAANYTLVIGPDTRYVNVKRDDIVAFNVGGKTFAWNFDDPNYWPVDLAKIAPPGVLDHKVIAYVSPFRRYFGREDQ
ncbi:MAG: CzcE family metal-binding protein [Herminiimonas sp.]|nr:CzcE family metal-binding protein [Herminiimonas sp.]